MNKTILLILVYILAPASILAQDSTRTGVKYGFLPLMSFNSDNGIRIGTEVQRYDYRDNVLPFRSYTRINTNYSSDGAFALHLNRDQVKTLGSDIRTGIGFFASQNFGNYYFGDTEKYEVDKARFDTSKFYSFKTFRINTNVDTRIPLVMGKGISRIDIRPGIRFVYELPWGVPADRFINTEKIEGYDGAFLTFLELAMIVENRNSEFRAQNGYYVEIGSKVSPPGVSTHVTAENYVRLLGYLPIQLFNSLTVASRFTFQNTVGDTPYWFVPALGGSGTIRGVMYRRYASQNAMSYSVELRSWLLKIPFQNLELGLNVFVDGGRVFRNDNWSAIFDDHILALGFGGVMSIFTPDFILKYDIGFSEDRIGLYLGTGYSF